MVRKNLYFLAVSLAIGALIYFTIPKLPTAPPQDVNDAGKLSVSIVVETSKFLISIAFVIIGVLGGSIIGKTTITMENNAFRFLLFFSSIVFAAVSLVYGYLLYDKTLVLFSSSVPDINADVIQFCRKRQFVTLVLSALFFIWYLFNYYFYQLKKKKADEPLLFDND